MQYDLSKALKSMNPSEIATVVAKYSKHFGASVLTKVNKDGTARRHEDSDEDSEEDRVKEELLRQRNWLSSKLQNMNKSSKKLENERKKVQNDNLTLIQECNVLRNDNDKISKRVQLLEKKFKDLCGISMNNSEMIDNQIESLLKKASTITTKKKDTPFITIKKNKNTHSRSNLLANYYQQYTNPVKNVKNKALNKRGSRRSLNGLMKDLKLNQQAIQTQNLELEILRDQVSTFMDENAKPRMMKSGSQPEISGAGLEDNYQLERKTTFNKFPTLRASRGSASQPEL